MTHVVKIIELVGSSDKGWTEAAQLEAKKTIKDITGLEVNDMTEALIPIPTQLTLFFITNIFYRIEIIANK